MSPLAHGSAATFSEDWYEPAIAGKQGSVKTDTSCIKARDR
jgi:hypothetical protein